MSVDNYLGNVVSLHHFHGANGATISNDAAGKGWVRSGTAAISTAISKFGGSSGYFSGNGDYFSTSNSLTDFDFGSGDFTIESWIYLVGPSSSSEGGNKHGCITGNDTGTTGWNWFVKGNTTDTKAGLFLETKISGASWLIDSNYAFNYSQWYHVAVCRSGGTVRQFVDGLEIGSAAIAVNVVRSGGNQWIGSALPGTTWSRYFNGYIDELRITKGIARYAANFAAPTEPFPENYAVKSLLHFDGADGSTSITDVAGNSWSVSGNANITTVDKKFGTGGLILDGSGDYVLSPHKIDYDLGAHDFTLEVWFKQDQIGASIWPNIISKRSSGSSDYSFIVWLNGTTNDVLFTYSVTGVGDAATISGPYVQETNNWHHLAIVRNGTSLRVYVDGVGGTAGNVGTTPIYSGGAALGIGVDGAGGTLNTSSYWKGKIDEFRLTKGKAVYTADFTPPTQAFPDVLSIGNDLAGTIDALADAAGALGNDASINAFEGTLDATQNADAALSKTVDVQGAADGVADVSGVVVKTLAGTLGASADAAGTLTAVPLLSGTVAESADASGTLTNPTRALEGTADAAADAAGGIEKNASGTQDAAADAAAAPNLNLAGTQDAAANLVSSAYLTPQEDALARAFAPIKINVRGTGTATAPIKINVQAATGTATAPIKINVRGTGTATAPIVIAVVSGLSVQSWTLTASIGDVDVSADLTGQISVRMEEGGSRTAEFSLHVASTPVNPLAYVGKTVSIDLVRMISGVPVSAPLFRGVVEYPSYQPRAALLQLSCSQDLQHIIAALTRTAIDSITGGGYHRAVHGDILDNWDYAQACMSTQAASLDCGVMGNPRKMPWAGLPVWKTFNESEIDEPDIGVEFPRRADLVNQVDCTFEYRYHHLRERHEWLVWSGSWLEVEKTGPDQFPTVQDIESAVSGAGWQIVSGVYFGLPERVPYADGYIEIPRTATGNASIHAAQRHGQAVTETSTLKVMAPASIANSGIIARELRGTLASEWEPSAWESDIRAPLTGVAEAAAAGVTPFAGGFSGGYADPDALAATNSQSLGDFAQVPGGYDGGNMEMDWAPDAPRADAEAGIRALLNTAKVMILGSHRQARVSAAFEILPELDTDRAAGISIGSLSITGKVVAVDHVLDVDSGEASTRFTLAPSGIGAAGLVMETPVAAPVVDAADLLKNAVGEDIYSVPVLGSYRAGLTPYTDNLMGWLVTPPKTLTIVDVPDGQGNLIEKTVENPYYTPNGYPVTGFRVKMPGVNDARRNPAATSVSQDYLVQVPEDTFSL